MEIDTDQFRPGHLLSILNIGPENFFIWVFFCLFVWTAATLAYLFRETKTLRILICVSVLLLYLLSNSFGKVSHSMTFLVGTSFILALADFNKKYLNEKSCIFYCQLFLLSIYESAGLWKFRAFADSWNLTQLNETVLSHIAYSVGDGTNRGLLLDVPSLNALILPGYLLALGFELFSFLPIFYKKLIPAWGVMALLFHLSTGLFMNIWFFEQAIGALLILTIISRMNFETNSFENTLPELAGELRV